MFQGDRFIPTRPEEAKNEGAEQYRYEEIRLLQSHLSAKAAEEIGDAGAMNGLNRRRRRNSDASNEDAASQGSRDSNSNQSDNSQNTSSEDGDRSMN